MVLGSRPCRLRYSRLTPRRLNGGAAASAPASGTTDLSGGRRGGGGRGGAHSPPKDQAAIAKLGELPAWKPGVETVTIPYRTL